MNFKVIQPWTKSIKYSVNYNEKLFSRVALSIAINFRNFFSDLLHSYLFLEYFFLRNLFMCEIEDIVNLSVFD